MNFHRFIFVGIAALSCGVLFTGCGTSHTSPYQPGPVAGQAVGYGAGTVVGNVAGFGVGAVQGTAHGIGQSFNPDYHAVRYWRTETTADGRTIQVPYDMMVDQYGRPSKMPAPTGNPKPPRGTTVAPMNATNSSTNGAAK
jgi:hypothetical protein